VIIKVLVPLAMPSIFNSLRLLFGLAFGYIMLAEVIRTVGEPGLGGVINTSFRMGEREMVYLILLIIPLIALVIDRLFYWVQYELFPYRYGSNGHLARLFRGLMRVWESATDWLWRPALAHATAGPIRPADAALTPSGDHPAAATDVPKPTPSQTPDSSSEQ
jgi:NitT/TauT family transport system permease protein